MKVPPRYVWQIEVQALATLCNVPLRCTDAEVVESDGKRVLVCHGFDPAPDAPLVDEGTPEKLIVPVGPGIGVQVALPNGLAYTAHILQWAPKAEDALPADTEQVPSAAEAAQASEAERA